MASLSQRVWALCACIIGIVLTVPALAQETVHFRQQMEAGQTIDFDMQMQMEMAFDVKAQGQVVQQVQQKITNVRAGRMEIIEVENGKPVKIRVSYLPKSGGVMQAMGQQQPIPFPAAGQTVTVSNQGGMLIIDHDGDLDDQAEQELTALLDREDSMFPDRPLKVGEEFEVGQEALRKAFDFDPNGQATARGNVLAVREVNGRQQAQVRIDADLKGTVEQFLDLGLKIQGEGWFDVQTSRMVDGTVKGPMTISGQQAAPMQPGGQPVQMQFAGGGQISYSEKSTIHAAGAAPQADAPADAPANAHASGIPGFGAGPANADNNPFEQQVAPAESMAGRYSGDGMNLVMNEQGGVYAGTIEMSGKTARFGNLRPAADGSMSGKFNIGEASFDFSLTPTAADTFVLKTGQSVYTVKRQAAPQPANPFDQ